MRRVYRRLVLQDGRRLLLEVHRDWHPKTIGQVRTELISGIEVDGAGATRWFDGGTTERLHVVDRGSVKRETPMVLNLTHGVLEPEPQKREEPE